MDVRRNEQSFRGVYGGDKLGHWNAGMMSVWAE